MGRNVPGTGAPQPAAVADRHRRLVIIVRRASGVLVAPLALMAIVIGWMMVFTAWGVFLLVGGLLLTVAAYRLLATGQSRGFVAPVLTLGCMVVGGFWGLILVAWLSGFPGN